MDWSSSVRKLFRRSSSQTLGLRDAAAAADHHLSGTASAKAENESDTATIIASESRANASNWTNRFRCVRELGQGGMGRVVLAERLSDGLPVCLKFLHADTNYLSIEQECRTLLRLHHPCITALLDFSLQDKPPWLAIEYVSGSTLFAYLKEHAPLSVRDAVNLLIPILEALEYAHSQGVIHRDLKPDNIIIEECDGRYKLHVLDFGIAIIDQYDHDGRITARGAEPLGTLRYMAPEQLRGDLLRPACDIYAVGLIALEMLMGRSVFKGKTAPEVMYEKMTKSAGFALEDAPATVPAELKQLIAECTDPDPEGRPLAGDLLAVLKAIATRPPEQAAPVERGPTSPANG